MNWKLALVLSLIVLVLSVCFAHAQQPAGTDLSDKEITQNVYFAFSKDFHASYNTQLEVRTINGVVILTGYIEEASEIKRIAEIARGVAGVKSVDNRLSIKSAF